MDRAAIVNSFTYQAPKGNQRERYDELRIVALNMAKNIDVLCPDSREKSIAITKLEEALMWATKAIACNE